MDWGADHWREPKVEARSEDMVEKYGLLISKLMRCTYTAQSASRCCGFEKEVVVMQLVLRRKGLTQEKARWYAWYIV